MKNNVKDVNREHYLDLLRAVSALAVIVIHVSANNWYGYIGSYNWIVFTIYEGITRAAVPVFFMISGSLLLSKRYSFKKLCLKIIKLLIFLFVWAYIYKVIQAPSEYGSIFGIMNSIYETIYGNSYVHLWFIYSIIALYFISPILSLFVHNNSSKKIFYTIIAIFILDNLVAIYICLFNPPFITENILKYIYTYSIGYIGYFLLGYYLRITEFTNQVQNKIYILGTLAALLVICFVIYDCIASQTLSVRYWSYTTPFMAVYSCAWFIYAKNICNKINTDLMRIISSIANFSLGIYGVHFLFIIIFWQIGFDTFLFNGLFSVPIISAVVLVCSYIASYIIKLLPFLGKYMV